MRNDLLHKFKNLIACLYQMEYTVQNISCNFSTFLPGNLLTFFVIVLHFAWTFGFSFRKVV